MKRRIIIAIVIILILVVVGGIWILFYEKSNQVQEVDPSLNISMTILDETLTRTSATIIITDKSGKNNIYGEEYYIQNYVDGKWTDLEALIDNSIWNAIAHYVDESETLQLVCDWSTLYGKLDNGRYRIKKYVNIDNKKYYFTVEFTIDDSY